MYAASVIVPGNRRVHCILLLAWIHRLRLILLIPGTAVPLVAVLIMYRIPVAEVMIHSLSIVLKPNQDVSAALAKRSIARARSLFVPIFPVTQHYVENNRAPFIYDAPPPEINNEFPCTLDLRLKKVFT